MNAQEILQTSEFKRCSDFHGHICPGLSIGYRASRAGMEWLKENRAEDEEMVAIVETDACSADAVQVLTGCTFGKGNFIHKDHGKMVLTLLSRKTGQGVRVSVKDGVFEVDEEHRELLQKVMKGEADEADQARFQELHFQKSCRVLEVPAEKLFNIKPAAIVFPEKARIEPSKPCEKCGEPTMGSKLENINGKLLCRGCLE